MITCSGAAPRALEFYPSFKLGRLLNIIASTPATLRARICYDWNEVIIEEEHNTEYTVGPSTKGIIYLQPIFVIY